MHRGDGGNGDGGNGDGGNGDHGNGDGGNGDGGNLVFLVVTDDASWAQHYLLGGNKFRHPPHHVVLLPPAPPEVHLCALSLTQHVIISQGTFSWWAGFLCGPGCDVIYFNTPSVAGTKVDRGMALGDHFPPEWIGLGDD